MGLALLLGLEAFFWIANRLFTPTPANEAARAERFDTASFPRAQQFGPVPLFWGRVRFKGGNITQLVGPSETINSNGTVTFGWRAMQMTLGVPGQEVQNLTYLSKVWIGEKRVWSGIAYGGESAAINDPTLLGGPGRGGGVQGHVVFMDGHADQVLDAGSDPQTFANITDAPAGADPTLLSPLRGICHVWLSGWDAGESSDVDGYSFEVCSPTQVADLDPFDQIGDGDVNPVCVLYDLLTNPWGRLGIDGAGIDLASFNAAGATLATEGNGISLIVESAGRAAEVRDEILRQIDGVLYEDPITRLVTLALIRDDYTVGDLDSYDDSNVLDVTYNATTWKDTVNRVIVNYLDRAQNYEPRTAMVQDLASIVAQGGRVRTCDLNFPGVFDDALAANIASRELKGLSLPLASVRLVVDRDGTATRPGQAIKWSCAAYGITDMVLRVLNVGFGELANGRIVLDCVQDRFAFDASAYDQPDPEPQVIDEPWIAKAPTERLIEEAPRWIQQIAAGAGTIPDADDPRVLYLAVPRGTTTTGYRGDASVNTGVTYTDDTGIVALPGRAVLTTAYARTLDPYDTTTGLVIDSLEGATLAAATAAEIRWQGKNTIRIEDEFLAFETVTGTGPYTLHNVWRGLGDTVPVDHPAGARVWFLSAEESLLLGPLGDHAYGSHYLPSIRARIDGAAGGGITTPPNDARFYETFSIAHRALGPYPVADLTGEASKAPSIEEEGVDLTWRERDALAGALARGNDASQTVDTGTTYDVIGRKGTATEVVLVADTTGTSSADVALAEVGYGTLAVSVRSKLDVTMADDSVASLVSWQDPAVDVVAPEWRNLLRNPRYEDGDLHWTVASGSLAEGTTAAEALGGAGSYAVPTGTSDWSQTVDVTGYIPGHLSAYLTFYGHNLAADADDTLTVYLYALDAADGVLSTATYGPTIQSATQWNRHVLSLADLNASTAKLKVRVVATGVGVSGGHASVTAMALRLGQQTGQLLANADMEAGTFTSWTNVSNSFVADTTAPLYTAAGYARPGNFASAEIRQDVAIPAGYEIGATAVLEVARMNLAASDTGEVILEVRDGSSALASVTTGAEAISPTGAWVRRRLHVDVPQGATTVRVRVLGTRVAGTPNDTCFDDFDLQLHKHLDPDASETFRFDAPVAQYLPDSAEEWEIYFPGVTTPNLGLWDGTSYAGVLGTEPDMASPNGALLSSAFVGCWDADFATISTTALAFVADDEQIRTAGNTSFGNFRTAGDGFTVLAAIKSSETTASAERKICGRLGTTGWELVIGDDGVPVARLQDGVTLVDAVGYADTSVLDGAIHLLAMRYDPTAAELSIVSDFGAVTVSTATMGEIRCDEIVRFMIGGSGDTVTDKAFLGQIARLYLWRTAISVADLQSLITHGTEPSGSLTMARTGALATVVGSDVTGVLVSRFAAGQHPIGWSQALVDDGGSGYGLAIGPSFTNLCPAQDCNVTATWVGSGTYVTRQMVGPEGLNTGAIVQGDNTAAQALAMTGVDLAAGANVRVIWFAKSTGANHSARVELTRSTDVSLETHDFTATGVWQQFTHQFTTWDNATATAKIKWYGSNDGTSRGIYLAGPFYVSQDTRIPAAWPSQPLGAASYTVLDLAPTLAAQSNVEGELVVEGVSPIASPAALHYLAVLWNGGNSNDLRSLSVSSSAWAQLEHRDGTATAVVSETVAETWTTAWAVRGRWARAGLVEGTGIFAGVLFGDVATDDHDYDRVATWTPSATAPTLLSIGAVDFGDPLPCLVRSVTLSRRETRISLS